MGVWNLPNKITLSRLILAMGLFAILGVMQEGHQPLYGAMGWCAFGLFVLAAGTDWLDGWLARRYGLVTAFGRVMDPFVDKVVVCGTIVFLCAPPGTAHFRPWMVVLIIAREFFVSAIRGFMESRGVAFGADFSGKLKMFIQCIAIGAILFQRALVIQPGELTVPWLGFLEGVAEWLIPLSVWGTLAATLYSGFHYGRKASRSLSEMAP